MKKQIELIEKDQFEFDNLPDRPDKPTSQEIANIVNPIPSGVNDNAGCPTGMVGTFFGLTAPAGWLVCDGTKYNRTDYPSLFLHLSTFSAERRAEWGNADWVDEFNVPNLQGEFPRFSGTNAHSGQGNGGAIGVHQDGTIIPNIAVRSAGNGIYGSSMETGFGVSNYDSATGNTSDIFLINKTGTQTQTHTKSGTVRSTNTSFLPIIKY